MRDWFTNAFGVAVADVRRELVERGWFDRSVTPRPFDRQPHHDQDRSVGERLGWEHSQPNRNDLDIDR